MREKLLKMAGSPITDGWAGHAGKRYGTIEELKEMLLYKRIVVWTEDHLKLDDGTIITIDMSESDCCAHAGGEFADVELDAMITNINISKVNESCDEWGYVDNESTVTLFHNLNPIAKANMNAGHNGYYYSVGSLVIKDIHFPVVEA
mgnify:CR=1 FL=1